VASDEGADGGAGTGAVAEAVDLGRPEAIADPAAFFGPLLAVADVHPHGRPRGWAVLGHDAVADAFRDADHLSADRVSVLERVAARRGEELRIVVDLLSGWMIFRDPPEHTRLRVPVRDAFTHRRVQGLADLVEEVVERAFDDLEAHPDGNLTATVAKPVPALVIGALLGLAPDERPLLERWSDDLATIVFSLDPSATVPGPVVRAAQAFHELFGRLVDHPPTDDGLVARIADRVEGFSRTELIGMCTMLLFAGHETTTTLIQNATALLLECPELEAHLRSPGADLDLAVDELLRVQGPARTMARKARVDHERAGVLIRAGDTVLLSISAANHDPRTFEDPGTIDLARDPNPHLGFGWGLHHCLGAQLARLEAATYLRVLLRRVPELRARGPVPPLVGSAMGAGRGPIHLHTDR